MYNVASNVFDCYNAFTLTETDKMGILLNGIPPHSSCNPFLIGLGLCQYERTMRDRNHLLWCIIYCEIIISRGAFKKAASSPELMD